MNRRSIAHFILSSTALLAVACGGAPDDLAGAEAPTTESSASESAALSAPLTISDRAPAGLVSSTGNLYWTSNAFGAIPLNTWSVWRGSKQNVRGQEVALYSESSPSLLGFGNIVWALTNDYYGYFVANYSSNGQSTSYIKRVPLAGGSAVTIATSPAPIGAGELLTDGSRLYWTDAGGLRSVALAGGAVTTLVSTPVGHISLDATNVYFSQSSSILRVAKTGGWASFVVAAQEPVTALHVDANSELVFWGEQGGAVRSSWGSAPPTTTYQTLPNDITSLNTKITSIGYDGQRVVWTECVVNAFNSCRVKARAPSHSPTTVSSGENASGHVQYDSASLYWGTSTALRKATY